jgi:hypothetical protein
MRRSRHDHLRTRIREADGGPACAEVPGDRGGAARRQPLPHDGSRAVEGPHGGERSGPASTACRPLEARGEGDRLGQPSTPMPIPAPATQEVRSPPPARPPATIIEPKTAALDRLHIAVPRAFRKKLAAARDALSHSHPGASDAEILEVALDLLLERAKRRGLVAKPRKTPPPSAPDCDGIPAHVAREVWTRDESKCQWPLAGGGVCGSTCRVELDHIRPKARGGRSTVANLRCLCRPHNERAAREILGDDIMDRFTCNPRGTRVREPTAEYAEVPPREPRSPAAAAVRGCGLPFGVCGCAARTRTRSGSSWGRRGPRAVSVEPVRDRASRQRMSERTALASSPGRLAER